ncbi:MAG: hypothetical protein ABIZ80_21185, partial [Bryobacteraceae bacterium]
QFFALLAIGLCAAHLCHSGIVWAEEALPAAAAAQMLWGRTLYRDIWFDKPPMLPATYLLWGAAAGWPLRLAGTVYALLCCWLAWLFGRDLWCEREGRWAAGLLAFFLTFDIPSAVLPLAADLLMLAPHFAAIYLAWRGKPFWSGAAAGIAFLINSKGVFVAGACALWSLRALPALALGFALPNIAALGLLVAAGALDAYYEQVWKWGRVYAAVTFVEHPIRNAFARTGSWLGFHAALAGGALWCWLRDPKPLADTQRWRFAGWLALSLGAVALGWRFFPRYFFQLLPAITLLGARGISIAPRGVRVALLGVLLIPFVRFGPRYISLAADLASGHPHEWVDTAMDRDSREAAGLVRQFARPEDTLFVWGFRPELYVYTGLASASRFLDSQPVTGVPADRHLVQSEPLTPALAASNRKELAQSRPAIILDGLGLYNPRLAITQYEDLAAWLAAYERVGQSRSTVIYRRVR